MENSEPCLRLLTFEGFSQCVRANANVSVCVTHYICVIVSLKLRLKYACIHNGKITHSQSCWELIDFVLEMCTLRDTESAMQIARVSQWMESKKAKL